MSDPYAKNMLGSAGGNTFLRVSILRFLKDQERASPSCVVDRSQTIAGLASLYLVQQSMH